MNSGIFELGNVGQIHKLLLEKALCEGDYVVDATLGNGHDALFLAGKVGENGHVTGFDIQTDAILTSQNRLHEHGYKNFKFICDTHENMSDYVKNKAIKGVIFNLGYLPKGSKALTTKWPTTKNAVNTALELVSSGGFVSIMTYPGHEAGLEEDENLNDLLAKLDQKKFQVSHYQFINQKNQPPKLYWVSKRLLK